MLNNVSMVGRLTADVEVKHTDGGMAVADITIACQRDRKEKDGNYKSDFADWKLFGKTAEFLSAYASKGDLISCEGTFRQDSWVGSDGKNKYKHYFIANGVNILTRKKETSNALPSEVEEAIEPKPNYSFDIEDSDELPF